MAQTKEQAIARWTNRVRGQKGDYVYQFPAGHWACCTPNSPVGISLRDTGFIYPETNCKALQWEAIK